MELYSFLQPHHFPLHPGGMPGHRSKGLCCNKILDYAGSFRGYPRRSCKSKPRSPFFSSLYEPHAFLRYRVLAECFWVWNSLAVHLRLLLPPPAPFCAPNF